MLHPGYLVKNRYEVWTHLGSGSFGDTYVARDRDLDGEECVVKHLNRNRLSTDTIQAAQMLWEKEGESLRRLINAHPRIPRLLANISSGDEMFLVMEYLRGTSLDRELESNQVLRHEAEVTSFLKQILDILKTVHQFGFIHRDIKPSNIIRHENGAYYLVDFGAVKIPEKGIDKEAQHTVVVHSSTEEVTLKRTASDSFPVDEFSLKEGESAVKGNTIIVGTRNYAPPEQFLGRPRFSSDIYSLGLVAIEMLTSRTGDTVPRDPQGEVIWPIAGQYISDGLTAILRKMTRQNYSERYQSVEEVIDDLMALEGLTTGPVKTSRLWVKPRFWVSLSTILTALGLGCLGFVFLSRECVQFAIFSGECLEWNYNPFRARGIE